MALKESEFQIKVWKANISRYGYQQSVIGKDTGLRQGSKFVDKLKAHDNCGKGVVVNGKLM